MRVEQRLEPIVQRTAEPAGRPVARLLLTTLLLLAMLGPGAAAARAPQGFEEVNVPIATLDAVSRVGSRFEGLLLPQPTENVQAVWAVRNSLKEKGNLQGEQERLRALEQLRRDLGWTGLPEASAGLAVEAVQQAIAGHEQRALELAAWSIRLSPEEPAALLSAAWVSLRAGFHVLEAARLLSAWPGAVLRDPLARHRLLAELIALALPAGLAVALVLLLVAGLRHRRLLGHDLGHLLPTGSSDVQRNTLVAALLFTPIVLPLGLLGPLVLWSVLLGPYLRWTERIVAVFGLLLLIAAPLAGRVLDRQLTLPTSTAASIHRLQRGAYSPEDERRVELAARAAPDDPLLRYTLALAAKRSGDLAAASAHLEALLAGKAYERQALVLQAVVALAQRQVAEARRLLDDVVQRWPGCAAAHFDLYRIAQTSVNEDQAGPHHLSQAQRLKEQAVDALLADDSPGLNRFLMEDEPPLKDAFLGHGAGQDSPARFFPALAPLLLGWLPGRHALAIGVASLLAVLLSWLVATQVRTTHACRSCGGPLCRSCQPLVGKTSHCELCTPGLVLYDGQTLVTTTQREEAQRRIGEREGRFAALISLPAPGAGHVLQGRTVLGAVLLFCWCLLVLRVLLGGSVFAASLPWGAFPELPGRLTQAVAALLLVVLGQLGVRHGGEEGR